jgi:hypothetical protein
MKTAILLLLIIMVAFAGTADAANPVKLKSLGVGGGIFLPQEKWENGFTGELQADFGEIIKYVFLIPHVGYRNTSMSDNGRELGYSDLYFGAKFVGYFNSKPQGIYAGLGLQYHIIGQEHFTEGFDAREDEVVKEDLTRIGYTAVAGYLLKFKRVFFSLEPAYTVLPGTSNVMTITLAIGFLLP